MDLSQLFVTGEGIDWDQAAQCYINVIALGNKDLQVKATVALARFSKDANKAALVAVVPILVELLGSEPRVQAAAVYALSCVARRVGGELCPMIGQLGAIPMLVRLLPGSRDVFRKALLKCLSVLVSFEGQNRVILARNGGLEVIIDLLYQCTDDMKPYLLEILSALAMLREVRRAITDHSGLQFLVEAVSIGKLTSRTRAAQAIGLIGIARRVRLVLVYLGAVPALTGLLREGDISNKLAVANALGIISSHVDYIRHVGQAGLLLLYLDLLRGSDPLGREIAKNVFCVWALAEENAVLISEQLGRILEGDDHEEAKLAALEVLSDLAGYEHSISAVKRSGVIQVLVEILRDRDGIIREKASGVIALLSYDKVNMEAIVEAGAIPVFTNLLTSGSDELRESAAECLLNFREYSLGLQDSLNQIRL